MKKISTIKPNQKLKILRILKGLTQFELQRQSDVSHSTICMIERGIRRPTNQQKKKLSMALEVSEKVIFPEEE